MLTLYWCPKTRAARALWMLEELGQPFERVRIDIHDQAARTNRAFRAASPMGKVPALVAGETRLCDSGAICAWLADAYPEAGLGLPIGHKDRGRWLQWVMFTNSVIEPAMVEKLVPGMRTNPVGFGWGSFDSMIAVLRAGLAPGPWILGERFSAADVLLGTSVMYMRQFGALPDHADLHAYADRCLARPACQRAFAAEAEAG